jgi:primosomal protein N' (replication factor Y)
MEQRVARVVPDDPTHRELDYLIPDQWANIVQVGSRVRVALRSREILGTVVSLQAETSVSDPKTLLSVVSENPILSPRLLELARFISDYYGCSIEAAIRTMLPTVVRQAQIGFKRLRVLHLVRHPSEDELAALEKRAPRQGDVLRQMLSLEQPVLWKDLVLRAATTDRTIQVLVERGWLRVEYETQERNPYGSESFVPTKPLKLNPAQEAALQLVVQSVDARQSRPILLHGVTGSGKTEIYLQAIEHCLAQGAGALVLVPEISLTPQTVERFKMRFDCRSTQPFIGGRTTRRMAQTEAGASSNRNRRAQRGIRSGQSPRPYSRR